jgi:hypothetical protein
MLVIPNGNAERVTRRYQASGRCIYCGVTSGELTDGHIVPFAIAGMLQSYRKRVAETAQWRIIRLKALCIVAC